MKNAELISHIPIAGTRGYDIFIQQNSDDGFIMKLCENFYSNTIFTANEKELEFTIQVLNKTLQKLKELNGSAK
jgi:hypothetical protein